MRYLYVMFCPFSLPLLFRFKIGIAADPNVRAAQIQSDLYRSVGKVSLFRFSMPVFFTETMEGYLHKWYGKATAKVPWHRGHTEWFYTRNVFTFIVFAYYCQSVGHFWEFWQAIVLLFFPIPFDGILSVLIVFGLQILLIYLLWCAGAAFIF